MFIYYFVFSNFFRLGEIGTMKSLRELKCSNRMKATYMEKNK